MQVCKTINWIVIVNRMEEQRLKTVFLKITSKKYIDRAKFKAKKQTKPGSRKAFLAPFAQFER